jgi:hypothetical protein
MTYRHREGGYRHRLAHDLAWGGALVAIGAFWLMKGEGGFVARDAWLLAPVLIGWSGLVRIAVERTGWAVASGVMRLAVAGYLYLVLAHVDGWEFGNTWPVVVIAAGALTLARGLFDRDGAMRREDRRDGPQEGGQ